MTSALSQRRPWPWHFEIDGVGYVAHIADGDPTLVGQKINRLDNVAPTDYDYSSLPPYVERTALLGPFVGGMGLGIQTLFNSRRYSHATNADCSVGGRPMKGPEVISVTPGSTGGVRGFPEALHGGTLTVFALASRYVLRRQGDAGADWVVSKDFGAGEVVAKAARYKPLGGTDGMYATTEAGAFWQYDGAAWNGAVLPAGALACFVDVIEEELWIAGGNQIRKLATATADPLLAASWAGAITVGDASANVTWLTHLGHALLIFKEDGRIFTVDATGEAVELFNFGGRDTSFGRNADEWMEWLWVRTGDGWVRLGPAGSDVIGQEDVGPARMLDNDSPVRGRVVASAGHATWFNYAALYNPSNGYSYLCKFGSWVNPDDGSDYKFSPVLHGSIADFPADQITSARVIGSVAANARLYLGFASGAIAYAVLPSATPDPTQDANCRFNTGTAYVYPPKQHHNAQADAKLWRALSCIAKTIDSASYAKIAYSIAPNPTGYTDMSDTFTAHGQRNDLPDNLAAKTFAVRIELVNSGNATTPVLYGFALHAQWKPALLLQYDVKVKAGDYLPLLDGSTDPKSAATVKNAIKQHAANPTTITFLHPDEGEVTVSVTNYAEIVPAPDQRRGVQWVLPIEMVEFRTNETYGLVDRLGAYTVDDLASRSVDDLAVL